MRLTQDKLSELCNQLQASLQVKKLSLQELQSLIGSLNFVCQVVSPGREFIRRLIDATVGIKKARYRIRIKPSMKLDLEMWLEFLNHYNGVSLFPERSWVTNDTLQFFYRQFRWPFRGLRDLLSEQMGLWQMAPTLGRNW